MTDTEALLEEVAPPRGATAETVLSVEHYTDTLFSFRLTRPDGFRFRSGEFVMVGLPVNGKPLMRAYSVASANWDETVEFYSIKVPDGPLTSRLQLIKEGDKVFLNSKPVGTLVLDALIPGKTLFLLSTGTGFAPFASIIQDPEVYEKYDQVVVTHTCRTQAELTYSRKIVDMVRNHEYLGEMVEGRLTYIDSLTRERYHREGRITQLISSGRLFDDLNRGPLDPEHDRVMICGSTGLNNDLRDIIEPMGLVEGANARPGHYVVEKAFVG